MNNNFQCLNCGEQFYEPSYSTSIAAGKLVYKVKGSLMKCKCESSKIVYIAKHEGDYSTITFGRFNSMSDSEKKTMLHKRTEKHNSKPREQEYKKYLDKNFKGSIRGLDKN